MRETIPRLEITPESSILLSAALFAASCWRTEISESHIGYVGTSPTCLEALHMLEAAADLFVAARAGGK